MRINPLPEKSTGAPNQRLAGVVVLYNPNYSVLANILTYSEWLDWLAIIDNSESPFGDVISAIRHLPNAQYLGSRGNMGIAKALNLAANLANDSGFRWLLTMDQDSRFERGCLDAMINLTHLNTPIGIISPRHLISGTSMRAFSSPWSIASHVMMSGNLLNLEAYSKAGPFLEKLFIDYVDFEYCLRLRKFGYFILQSNVSGLTHQLGDLKLQKVLGIPLQPTHHSPLRKYYIARNRLYVMKTYPNFILIDAWAFLKEIAKTILLEKNKLESLSHTFQGTIDFLRGRFGPHPDSNSEASIKRATRTS